MTIYTAIFTATDNQLSTTNSPNNSTTNSSTNNDVVNCPVANSPPLIQTQSIPLTVENHFTIDKTQVTLTELTDLKLLEITDISNPSSPLSGGNICSDLPNIMLNQASITEINPVNTITSLSQTTPTFPSSSSKKDANRVRNKSLKIRFSESEYQQLSQKAGNQSLAAFMRDYCLAAPDYRPKQPAALPKIDPALLRILAGATNNLNQIARHLNQQAARNQTVQISWAAFELAKVADSLWRIEHAG